MILSPHQATAPAPSPPFGCWCGRGTYRRRFRTRRFGLVQCTECGCFRIDPPPISGDHEGADFYTDYYSGVKSGTMDDQTTGLKGDTRVSRFWRVVEQVPDLGRPKQRVADIGCGEGGLCNELRAAGWPFVVGFDLSRTRISRARKKHPGIEFHDSAFPAGSVPDGSLDLVIMDNVVEHLADPVATLRRVAPSLRADARLVLITPNMSSGQFRLLGRRWTAELAPHAHIFLFSPDAISRLLSMCGFELEVTGSFHLAPNPLREIFSAWSRLGPKEAIWRAMNEAGAIYARLVRAGPMLFAVARRQESR
jgi:2-polyprenyl-3-methyl-5-hydroxy-6-metoxy-1,4-benzoquinol methylase